ncbi:MAG: hypothetical protein KH451_06530 [Holdemanella biformis]|nr:hypothetical protein [Holdemanella biformis]
MNNKKTLTSLAAVSMVITQAGQMSVFAKGATADPETPAEKEEIKVEKTQKELLEEQIRNAQEKVDGAQSKLDEATPSMKDSTNQLNTVKANHNKASDDFKVANYAAYSYISNEISVNKNAIEQAKAELDALKVEKERLEKESFDSETQKAQLEKDYQDAQNKYNELVSQGTIEGLTEQIASQQKVVESVKVSLQEAQAKYDTVKGQFDKAKNKVNDLEAQITAQQSKVDTLSAQSAASEAAMQEASEALNNAQQAYDAATDETAKAELESQLATAQANLIAVTEAYNAANTELVNENGVLSSLQGNLETVKSENQAALDAYNEAQSILAQAQQDKVTADNQLTSFQQSLEATKASIAQAEKDVTVKKDLLDAAKKSTEELSKLVDSTKAAYDAVQAQWNQGSLGFYENIGDTQAVDVIKEGISLGTTTLGDIGDSTNLFNMKVSIPLIAECNRLRALNGLPELKTSGLMMAISQVKNNHSVYREGVYDSPHTGLYNTGENIASGFTWDLTEHEDTDNGGKGPFRGWYGFEKDYLNSFYKEHPEEKNNSLNETIMKYPDLAKHIGHYLNILRNYDISGVAYIPQDKNNLNNKAGDFAQEFSNNTNYWEYGIGLPSATDVDKKYDNRIGQMTVSEFEAKFNEYYDSLRADLKSKKAAYEGAKKAFDDAQNNGNAIANATKAYEEALAKLEKLKANEDTTNLQIQEAKKAVTAAASKVTEEQENVSKAEKVKNEKAETVKVAQAKVDAQKKVVDSKVQDVANAKIAVDDAEKTVSTVKDTIKKSEESATKLKVELDAAKAEMDSKKKAYEETKKLAEKANEELSKLNANKAEEETKKAGLSTKMEQTKSDKETAEKELKFANVKLKELKESKKTREDLKASMEGLSNKLKKLQNVLTNVSKGLKENGAKSGVVQEELASLEKEQARLDDVLAYYHTLVDEIVTMTSGDVDLTKEEAELLSKLQIAVEALENVNEALADAQTKYDVEKVKYDALAKDVENAKAELAKAEAALNAYLNPAPAPSPETKPEVKPETKPSVPETKPAGGKNENVITTPAKGEGITLTETKKEDTITSTNTTKTQDGKVNTAAEAALGFYALSGVLGLAGVAFTGKHARKED